MRLYLSGLGDDNAPAAICSKDCSVPPPAGQVYCTGYCEDVSGESEVGSSSWMILGAVFIGIVLIGGRE